MNLNNSHKPEEKLIKPGPSRKALLKAYIWEVAKVVVISLAIIIPVRYFLIQPFYVKGASMEPNFYDHEYLIINEIDYRLSTPQRGDIIVFRYPRIPQEYFIKRIIGLPGETVEIDNGQVSIFNKDNPTGKVLDESAYLEASVETKIFGQKSFTLGQNEYFVMGDNRESSMDSRSFGPITRSAMIGKVWLRGWPINRLSVFDGQNYGF